MFSTWPCIRLAAALATLAITASGCAGGNNATSSQAANQGEASYKTMYGLSSEGTTTDLYTELFGSRQATSAPQTAAATAQPAQPLSQTVTAPPATPPQPAATSTRSARVGQNASASAGKGAPQPISPPPVVAAQQPPPPPAPPPEPDVPTAYGITANGPTTDLYTVLFGRRDGQ